MLLAWSSIVEVHACNIPVCIPTILIIVNAINHLTIRRFTILDAKCLTFWRVCPIKPCLCFFLICFSVYIHTKQLWVCTCTILTFCHSFCLLKHSWKIRSNSSLAPCKVVVISYSYFLSSFSRLCSYQYHTKCSTSTVDSGRRSIFQYRD